MASAAVDTAAGATGAAGKRSNVIVAHPPRFSSKKRTAAEVRAQDEIALQQVLDADMRSSAGLCIGLRGRSITRRHYAERTGIPLTRINALRHVFKRYESQVRDAGLMMGELERRLRLILSEHAASPEGIRFSKAKKISRAYYAARLGVGTHRLIALKHVFQPLEDAIPYVGPGEISASELRSWIDERYQSKTLELRSGRIDRSPISRAFGWKRSSWTSLPAFQAILTEYDERVAREGYTPATRDAEVDLLRATLIGACSLNSDHLTLNRRALSEATGISISRLKCPPFSHLIEAKEADILKDAQAERMNAFLHGRLLPFSDLSAAWPAAFLGRVAVRFTQVFSAYAPLTVPGPYREIRNLLNWIAESADDACQDVIRAVRGATNIPSDSWEDAIHAFRAHIKAGIGGRYKKNTAHKRINDLRICLTALESGGVVPIAREALSGIKHANRSGGHRRSVAEAPLPPTDDPDRRTAEYVEFASRVIATASEQLRITVSTQEGEDFLYALSASLREQDGLPEDPANAILNVLNSRLAALHEAAVQRLRLWQNHLAEGRELLARADIPSQAFLDDLRSPMLSQKARKALLRRYFPGNSDRAPTSEEAAIGTANLLAIARDCFLGVLPSGQSPQIIAKYGKFFARRYREYGGFFRLSAYLTPHSDVLGAALTLYLLETGANVAVGRTLDADCIEDSDLADHKRITGYKARAEGRPIICDLPDSSNAIQALLWLRGQVERYRGQVSDVEDKPCLFLVGTGSRFQLITQGWYTSWFGAFVEEVFPEQSLRLTPSMIRPSVLLKAALENDGRLALGIAIGQHTEPVTQGYQVKWPVRLIYDTKIRAFQNSFEALVARNIERAALKLGISSEQFEQRLSGLRATGLGTFCADPYGKPGREGSACTTLDCWNECPQMIVVAEKEAIASLQLWQKSLLDAAPTWERDRPERWEEVWLPWLCLAQVVEERMARGPLLNLWRAAQARALEIENISGYAPPKPW